MKKIIIVGAGISGLCLANLLEKNNNYEYKIIEKRSNIDLLDGYGIQLSVNGVKLLNKIGFKEMAVQDIFYPKNINFFEARNCELISNINISRFNEHGNYYTTLKRSKLMEFLLKNLPSEKILFNSNVESIEHNNIIKIYLNDNKQEQADYLVVSDGVFSKTKKMVLQKNPSIYFNNSVAIRGNLKYQKNKDISVYLGPNFHFVVYPINQNNESNFISISRFNDLQEIKNSNNLVKNKILNKISSKTSYILDNNLKNTSLYPVYVSSDFLIPDNKNIFISGDALFAFPPSFAQGASQSIESAFEIFNNIQGISNGYYQNRKIKTKKIEYRSKFNHYAFHVSNPLTSFFRNISLKFLSKNNKFLENYLGKIYR